MDMFKIFRKLLLLGTIVFLMSSALVTVTYDEDHYMAAGRDKYAYLRSVPPPRIILVGGSNVVFGVDSGALEESLQAPVINMGLAAGLGLEFMLNEIEASLQDSDIVLLIPEYEHFYSLPLKGRSSDLGAAVKYCPECFLDSNVANDPQQLILAASGVFQGVEGGLFAKLAPQEDIHSRKSFNQRGDMVAHLGREGTEILNHVQPVQPGAVEPAVELLNSFQQTCNRKNTQVFLIYPPIPEREYHLQKQKFLILHRLLQEKSKIPILGVPEDFVYPISMFYDTVYHLNAEGRDKRTERVIELLGSALAK